MAAPRYLEKFTSLDGSSFSYTWPLNRYEYEFSQALRSPRAAAIGLPYALRLRGTEAALLDVARERVRCVYVGDAGDVDDEIDEMLAELHQGAFGKLWWIDQNTARRWAYAELAEMPQFGLSYARPRIVPIVLGFDRFGPVFDETKQDGSDNGETVTSDAQTWVVANPGNLPATLMQIRLRANGSAGIVNPVITNETNGYVFQTSRDSASDDDEIRLDTERGAVEYSDDDGASYADDFANYALPTDQVALSFRLEPGNNTIRFNGGGTPNLEVEFEFYPVVLP